MKHKFNFTDCLMILAIILMTVIFMLIFLGV